MRKLKLLLAAAILGTGQMWAQTDVTSTYLTNADFSQGTVYTDKVYGYGHDGTPWGFQKVEGWTINVVDGDDDNGHPNSAMAGAIFSYGTTTGMLQGGGKTPPTLGPTDNEGNCLGLVAVWGKGGYYYQEVTFPAGEYTINIPVYNQQGIKETTTYFGFIPNSGTSQTIATPTTTGAWVTLTKTFSLAEETAGRICLGYKSNGSSSGDNPHLFIDKVQILYKAIVVKDVLANALTAATNANATLNNSDLTTAIATAQAVYDDADATQDEVNSAAATLNAATELAMSAVGDVTGVFLANPDFESCTAETSDVAAITKKDYSSAGWTNASAGSFTTIVVTAYGGGVKVANSTTPSTKKDGTTVSGNTLGIIAGWGDNVIIQSNDVTLPAGVYTLTVDHYLTSTTSNYGNNSSKFGFVTSGSSYLVSSTTFSEATWTTETVTFTLTESTTGKIQIGLTGLNKSGSGSPAVFYDDITITYKSFLAGAKEAWDEAVTAANQAKTDCPNVTGEELTALNAELAKAEPTTVEGYNTATEALTTATTALRAAATSYNNLVTVNGLITAAGTLKYADADKKPSADVTATSASDADTKAASQYAALRAYYESHALAENVDGAVDMTGSITNAANPSNTNGWTLTNTVGNSKMRTQNGEPWTNSDGTTPSTYFDTNSWGTAFSTTMTQEVALEAGKYLLSVKARGNGTTTYQLTAKDEATDIEAIGNTGGVFGRGWNSYTVEFEVTEDEAGATIGMNLVTGNSGNWLSFSDFKLVQLSKTEVPMATDADYAELNTAIEAAEAHTLGFDANEYAPYNNVEAIKALATAKAFDTTAENRKKLVTAATTALTSATWTANTEEVDAIFDGQFATTEANSTSGNINLPGWTKVDGIRLLVKDETVDPGLAYTDGKAAVFSWGGTTLTYGEQEGYTLPMNKHSIYELTFKASAWRDGTWPSWVSVDLDGVAQSEATSVPGKINAAEGNPFRTYTYYLEPTADNSVLKIYMNQHFTLADLSLKLAVAEDVTISEAADYTPAKNYANVTLNRTIKGENIWNTFVVPFDISNDELKEAFGNDVAVAEYSEEADGENSTVNFNSMETPAITANTPVLLKGNSGTNYSFTGKLIKEGDAQVAGTNFNFVGTYVASTTIAEGDYFIGSNNLYKSDGTTTTISGTRAYLKANTTGARIVNFYLDGEDTTGIMNIDGTITTGKVYNMQGQLVKNAKNGIFIQNGKKVVIK